MKILDRNYKLFGVVNPVDLVVGLLVVAVAVVGYSLLRGGPTFGPGDDLARARVTLVVREIRDAAISVDVGDEIIKTGVGTIGNVSSVSVRPTSREVPTADGDLRVVDSALFEDAVIVIDGEGRFTDGGVLVGDVLLSVNEQIDVKTARFAARVTVTALELAE